MASDSKRGKLSGNLPTSVTDKSSFMTKNSEFLCPICFDIIDEAYVTICGHTYCHKCISRSLEVSNRCPKCHFVLGSENRIFPNFLLNELITIHKKGIDPNVKLFSEFNFGDLATSLQANDVKLKLPDVNLMLNLLSDQKKKLECESRLSQLELVQEFFRILREKRQHEISRLQRELTVIDRDAAAVEESIRNLQNPDFTKTDEGDSTSLVPNLQIEQEPQLSLTFNRIGEKEFSGSSEKKRKRLNDQIGDLETCYMEHKAADLFLDSGGKVDDFNEIINKFTRYSDMRPLATLNYSNDLFNNSSIVSSIEFDKDGDYFAIAGVTKRVKLYEYSSVVNDVVDIHYPVVEMVGSSKVSCLTWNMFHKNYLGSSDYEGIVTLWDVSNGKRLRSYQEHEKRCWSVDFNHVDTNIMASGSDDAKVKLWSVNVDHSVATLEAKANICCVKFNPQSRYHLAFGSADHCVHYYDLRKTKEALCVFKGHKKAVSYVKFLSGYELVSASTDSQLKLWSTAQSTSLRSLQGHTNEKNFVGLASDGDYVCCGSENNSLYVYYKKMSKPLLNFRFDVVKSVLDMSRKEEEVNEFISAVCWKPESNVVVAANSQEKNRLEPPNQILFVWFSPLRLGVRKGSHFNHVNDIYLRSTFYANTLNESKYALPRTKCCEIECSCLMVLLISCLSMNLIFA